MIKEQVGGTVYERTGDDYYNVYCVNNPRIVEVQQYDSIGHRYHAINFFAETAPNLIAMIQKAAGIQPNPVEYEYNIEETDTKTGEVRVGGFWGTLEDKRIGITNRRDYEKYLADYTEHKIPNKTFKIVRRPKVGYEVVEGE
jgi:hypothetical protein